MDLLLQSVPDHVVHARYLFLLDAPLDAQQGAIQMVSSGTSPLYQSFSMGSLFFSSAGSRDKAGILVVFLFTLPMHRTNFIFFFLFMIIYNVYGHLGWELYPKNFHKTRIGKWINTSVAHNQHHQYFKGNYGLYFLFWDRIMGTLRKDYDEQFETVKAK